MTKKACPQCTKYRDELEMQRVPSGIRCIYCIKKGEKNFIDRTIDTLSALRDAAIEEDIDQDLADQAYDDAVDRLMARYR